MRGFVDVGCLKEQLFVIRGMAMKLGLREERSSLELVVVPREECCVFHGSHILWRPKAEMVPKEKRNVCPFIKSGKSGKQYLVAVLV